MLKKNGSLFLICVYIVVYCFGEDSVRSQDVLHFGVDSARSQDRIIFIDVLCRFSLISIFDVLCGFR